MKIFRVDFLGIGTEKAATYWVADILREHPEILFAKQKELAFFNEYDQHFLTYRNPRYARGIEWYKKHFPDSLKGKLLGEYTPTYLYSKRAASRIKKHFPDAKLICTFRDPVKRAFSQYLHDSSIGIIPKMSFEEAIEKYDAYIKKGYYAKYLKNYFDLFPKRRILILLVKDIKRNPAREAKKVYKFLNLKDVNFAAPSLYKKPNPASTSRFPFLNRFLIGSEYKIMNPRFEVLHKFLEDTGARKAIFWATYYLNRKPITDYPKINPYTEKRLRRKYRKDIEKLEKMIGRSLKDWK